MNSNEHPMSVRFEQDDEGEQVRIFLTGELDVSTAPDLLAELQAAHAQRASVITLDLSKLDFIDSSGLSVLVTMHKRTSEEDTRFVLASPSPVFLKVAEVAGLHDFFDIDDSVPLS